MTPTISVTEMAAMNVFQLYYRASAVRTGLSFVVETVKFADELEIQHPEIRK